MLGRLCLLATILATAYCYENTILDNLRDAGASRVAVLGTDGNLRASENYDLKKNDRKAVTGAFANPSDAIANGLDVYNKHINVEKADEKFIEGSFSGNKFYAFKTQYVIVASVWPETYTHSGAAVQELIDFLAIQRNY